MPYQAGQPDEAYSFTQKPFKTTAEKSVTFAGALAHRRGEGTASCIISKAHFTMCKPQISRQGSAISKGCLEYPPISQGRGGNGVGWSPVGVGGGVANCSGWSCVSELHVLTPSSGLPAWLVRLCLSFAWRLFPPDFLLGLVAQPHNPGMFTGAFTTRKPFVYIH